MDNELLLSRWHRSKRSLWVTSEDSTRMTKTLSTSAVKHKWGIPVIYRPPAPVAMKDHQIRDLVNELRDIAVEYYGTQQLRERIAKTVRAAMLQGAEQTKYRAIVERIAEIIHGKVTDIDLLTVTVKSMKDKLQK